MSLSPTPHGDSVASRQPSRQGVGVGPAPIDFYGKMVTTLRLFGQARWGDCSPGRVVGTAAYHVGGVVVDRSVKPNAIWCADLGNSRILGFRSYASKSPELVIGQPDQFSSAPNGDCNVGRFGRPTRASLCLMDMPSGTNQAEQWGRTNLDVDSEGNLYVVDHGNDRVLVFNAPFSADKSNGKGDTLPDLVIGQADYTSNGMNRGRGPGKPDAQSLYLSYGEMATGRGVSVDGRQNVWVADTFNHRVLRFPKGKTTADLVLGQRDFTTIAQTEFSTQATTRLPTVARVHPSTGELYVVDETGDFGARILVFTPPFKNGMARSGTIVPKQVLAGDFVDGYTFSHCTGLFFREELPALSNRIDPARRGILWAYDLTRLLLLARNGEIVVAIGATDLVTHGFSDRLYADSQMDPSEPFNPRWVGGRAGFDDESNIYLADGTYHRVARYALPYVPRTIVQNGQKRLALPYTNGGFFPKGAANSVGPAHRQDGGVGVITFRNQLILRDQQRYMVWVDYMDGPDRSPADMFIGQDDGWSVARRNHLMGRSMHTVDNRDRLWATGEHGRLLAYQLPFAPGAEPLRTLISLYWDDDRDTEAVYSCAQPVAFENATQRLWLFDSQHYRLLRVRVPDDLNQKLYVDAVIGQTDKEGSLVNRGMRNPDAASFGAVNDIKFDRQGNLFVNDNTYELHENGRIIAFLAEDMLAISTMFPPIQAKRVYVAERFDQHVHERTFLPGPHPMSPVCIAFNDRNEMVVGNDGYYGGDQRDRKLNQLFLYRHPLTKLTPDGVIELPMGAPGEITFDSANNLASEDHTYNKVWVINLDTDPSWIRHLDT